jgi:hypothetical protein
VKLIRVEEGDKVVSVARIAREELDTEGEPAGEAEATPQNDQLAGPEDRGKPDAEASPPGEQEKQRDVDTDGTD